MIEKKGPTREHIAKSLLNLLDQTGRRGWWGKVGVTVLIQDGKIQIMEKTINETQKGNNSI